MEFIFMFSLILTWIVVFLMTRKGTNSTSKRKIDALRKWNIEYYYGKTVEAAREGNLKALDAKKRFEESPEFEEFGLTLLNL